MACEAETGAKMLSIHSKVEQDFIENYLFNENKVNDSIWIGLKKDKEKFEWTDSSALDYQNWAKESPSNETLDDCVQIIPDGSQMGKWTDGHCTRRNSAVCQKHPDLFLIRISKLLSVVKEIESLVIKKLDENKIQMEGYLRDIFRDDLFFLNTFNDTDGKHKALIYPLIENKKDLTWDKATQICRNFNFSLVEIESSNKQIVVNSFSNQISYSLNKDYFDIWLNARQVSTGQFRWLRSNATVNYTNWEDRVPTFTNGDDYISINYEPKSRFGFWNIRKNDYTSNFICEIIL
jgi:hypothetical protein